MARTQTTNHSTPILDQALGLNTTLWRSVVLCSISLFAIALFAIEATAEAPEIPARLVGNYDDTLEGGDACLSVRPTVVSYAALSHDSERGCGVDLRVVGVSAGEIRLLDGDRLVRMIVTEREIRFHRSARPMCAHLQSNQFRFLRSGRRAARECFE